MYTGKVIKQAYFANDEYVSSRLLVGNAIARKCSLSGNSPSRGVLRICSRLTEFCLRSAVFPRHLYFAFFRSFVQPGVEHEKYVCRRDA